MLISQNSKSVYLPRLSGHFSLYIDISQAGIINITIVNYYQCICDGKTVNMLQDRLIMQQRVNLSKAWNEALRSKDDCLDLISTSPESHQRTPFSKQVYGVSRGSLNVWWPKPVS